MKQGHGHFDSRLEVNLTPLLDLVLQLIMFFMLTVNFVRVDQVGDRVDLPVVQSAMPLTGGGEGLVFVNINQDGEKMAAGKVLANAVQLRNYLSDRKDEFDRLVRLNGIREGAQITIVVRADKDAPWGEVWNTLDECNRAGYRSWQLRVIKRA